MEKYLVLGIMSGSSMDGVDLAFCEFSVSETYHYKIIKAETIPYPEEWKLLLSDLPHSRGELLTESNILYGRYLGLLAKDFILKNNLQPSLIASHGHTIFHNPKQNYTLQIGCGQAIAVETGITTVADFRQKDILLGGQGAPLAPIGDELLFPSYDVCLNLGGIANISYHLEGKRLAFDVCPANQLLNHLSRQFGKEFDENGNFASLGKLNVQLFDRLNADLFYEEKLPKSLSNQSVRERFIKILDQSKISIEDKLYTCVKHIAYQLNQSISNLSAKNIFITGGGAHNIFLVDAISYETQCEIVLPEKLIIDYKEAMIFGLMGLLRYLNKINCISSATGANKDSIGGIAFIP